VMELPSSDNSIMSNSYFWRYVVVENDVFDSSIWWYKLIWKTCLSPGLDKNLLISAYIPTIVHASAY
jgi:hypothetical protein